MMIRIHEDRDWDATWRILEPVFRAGDTYVFSPDTTEDEARCIAHSLSYLAAWARMEVFRDGNTNIRPEK